jgi:hypothetical protein
VREELDDAVCRCVHPHNWQAVEHEMQRFSMKALDLKQAGWDEESVEGCQALSR